HCTSPCVTVNLCESGYKGITESVTCQEHIGGYKRVRYNYSDGVTAGEIQAYCRGLEPRPREYCFAVAADGESVCSGGRKHRGRCGSRLLGVEGRGDRWENGTCACCKGCKRRSAEFAAGSKATGRDLRPCCRGHRRQTSGGR